MARLPKGTGTEAQASVKEKRKRDAGQKQKPKTKSDGEGMLEEQVLSMGGDKSDLSLLAGVRDDVDLIVGDQELDPELTNDVSKFLSGLKSGGDTIAETIHEVKPKHSKEKQKPKKKDKSDPSSTKATQDTPAQDVKLAQHSTLPRTSKSNAKLVFPPAAHWYTAVPQLDRSSKPLNTPTPAQISNLMERASTLLTSDAASYQASAASTGHSAADSHFLNTILVQGTLSDRLSALTLLVQASPLHNTKALETLKGMAERGRGKGGREEGLKAMRCVVDWWVGGGAPGRKLRYFRDQPLLHPNVTDQVLLMWYFEDWLKKYFFSILQILEIFSLDPLPYVRTQALGFISTLLREKPEQEQNLLRLLVNKLGDTEKSVCSRASYHLLQLLQTHPNMKLVIVREMRSLIFRPAASTSASASASLQTEEKKTGTHVRFADDDDSTKKPKEKSKTGKDAAGGGSSMDRWNSHAWYYASVTLNQVVLTSSEHDRDVARTLIEVYFEMFREILGAADDEKAEGGDDDLVEGQEASASSKKGAGKAKGGKPEKKRAKGKEKEVRGAAGFAEVEDANSRLISAVLAGVNRALPFAKVAAEGGNDVLKKHIDTLFLITHKSTFNISLQALMLMLQITSTFAASAPSSASSSSSKSTAPSFAASLTDRFYRTLYASLTDPRLATSNKQAMYLNLLFKALKADKNAERVKAFVRRFLQVLVVGIGGAGGAEFVAGGLYLLGELFSIVPGLRQMLSVPLTKDSDPSATTEGYDPRKRDPQYAHASASPLYELLPLLHHYHPAISLHARQLLSATPLSATPDLSLNTLSHFLDRFVYKNPKKPKTKGASAMQPAASAADGASGVKLMKGEVASMGGPVNEESWWKRRVEDVPVDQVFFHKYFNRRNEKEKGKAAKLEKRKAHVEGSGSEEDEEDEEENLGGIEGGSEAEEVDEEEGSDKEEAEIWKAMKQSLPAELQDEDLLEDSDDLPSDLEEDDEEVLGEEDESASEDEDESESEDGEHDDEEDDLSLAEASDAEDLIPLDADIPEGLIDYDGSESDVPGDNAEYEEWGGFGGGDTTGPKKRKRGDKADGEDGKGRRKKLRSLPTFASYEDYAKMIEESPADNL